jgi:hypothetical protein
MAYKLNRSYYSKITGELDEETKAAVAKAYRIKMEALELLHYQLGHLPYGRRLIRLEVIPGYVVDKKFLRKVQRKTCKGCMEAKLPGPSHKGQLPVPDLPWRRLAMDLSARFHSVLYQGNFYQMAIIDTKTKYVWDYYLKPKDE